MSSYLGGASSTEHLVSMMLKQSAIKTANQLRWAIDTLMGLTRSGRLLRKRLDRREI